MSFLAMPLARASRRVITALAVTMTLIFAGLTASPTLAAERTADYEEIQKSTVRIMVRYRSGGRTRYRYGTGWIIEAADNENNAGLGTVVTAAHVVTGATSVRVRENNSDEVIVSDVKSVDKGRDLAFIEVKDLSGSPLTLSQTMPKLGEALRTLGFTGASDQAEQDGAATSSSLKSGSFSKAFRGDGSLDLIEHDIVINPGYSGGPLLDDCGRVIGVVIRSGGHIQLGNGGTINTAEGVGFAIAGNEIIKFAGDENIDFQRDESECGAPAPAPAPTAPTPPTDGTNSGGDGNEAPGSNQGDNANSSSISNDTLIAGAVIALGLLIAGLAAFFFLRKNKAEEEEKPTPANSKTSLNESPTPAGRTMGTQAANETTISLSGVDPQGKPISLRFTSSDASRGDIWLGADRSDVVGFIDDQRDNRLISRVHAKLGYDGSRFTLLDNKSTNGSFVGSKKLKPMAVEGLNNGDSIKLADVDLTVSIT